ncbi:MAG: TlpA family protein disulfide reductase [Candidatus Actinomarina sp.]|jgi:thiol:disulfide interchange protein|nr:TlpA family protein disulfide reductase [Candidatus Actinomarina sp.]MDA2946774.1 TlpA disulfide reductase family protein [Actinomycetota bacterium]MBL6763100.1 TlpA family protein disulfide reductase [Candidatus Actinomarina sp.]MBL6836303.1 TlpA family protein disulfide reductase [Candidatus Actinomarina sp.]MDA3008322.1 TlpA disulfide reductase family protein [Actinomycetota bacterium]
MIKRNLLLILLTGLIGIAVLNASTADQEINSISDINNGIQVESLMQLSSVRVEQINTDYIVLNLWASWCIPCQNEVDELLKISEQSNITVIGILVDDSASNGREFIEDNKITYKNILEEEESDLILSQFSWTGIPTTLVLDSNLLILHTLNGEITANEIIELTK